MNVISVPTILVCTFIAMVATSVAMAAVWVQNRNERAAGFWGLAFMLGGAGAMTIATLGGSTWFAIPMACGLVTAAYVSFWQGYRAFTGRKVYSWTIVALPALQILAGLIWPEIRLNPNYNIAIQSAIIGILSLSSAVIVYSGRDNEKLSMSAPLAAFLSIHAIFHFIHIGHALYDPSPIVAGRLTATWWKLFMMENFLNVIVVAMSSVLLIKERSEERHRRASETDSLTGIANRRAFVQQAEKLLPQAEDKTVLAILDIDDFKSINDRFGHQAGDIALIEFSRTISSLLPKNTLYGRIGGEEFAIFLPATDLNAPQFIENLRRRIEEIELNFHGSRVPLTVSIGAVTVEQAGRNFDHLVAAADCALYAAKEEGRNRVTLFSPSQRFRKIVEEDGEKRVGLATNRISRSSMRTHKSVKTS